MTANLLRFDPQGTNGAAVDQVGTPLSNATVTGAGTLTYNTAAGADRGANVGVEAIGAVADTAYVAFTPTVDVAGSTQAYVNFRAYPSSGRGEFLGLRSQSGNTLRVRISSTGTLDVFDSPGSLLQSMAVMALDTWYRIDLKCQPDTSTTGVGSVTLSDDSDSLLDSWSTSSADFGTDKTISWASLGDIAGSGGDLHMWLTQFAVDTGSTPPTIAPVAKNVTPTRVGVYDLVWTGSAWK